MIGIRGQTKSGNHMSQTRTNIVHMSTIAQHIKTCALTQYIKNNGTRGGTRLGNDASWIQTCIVHMSDMSQLIRTCA